MSATVAAPVGLAAALEQLAAEAARRDLSTHGLEEGLALLEATGLLGWNAIPGSERPPAATELALVRAVAAADGSVARVLDGHFNGLERLAVQGPAELAERELALAREGLLRVGVWGGDPRPGEGEPAWVVGGTGVGERLQGAKTFCSGAGVLDRAIVLARDPAGGVPVLVWIDLRDSSHVEIDTAWYRSSGLRASASHRVRFHDAPVLARIGPAGAISAQPWFGRDALRTAATWAGMADAAVAAALDTLASRPGRGELEALAAGELLGAQRTLTVWLEAGARAMDAAAPDLAGVALHGRVAISATIREILSLAARACGSHPFATGAALDRHRRDLELFLLQHRLEPALVRAGAAALDGRAPRADP